MKKAFFSLLVLLAMSAFNSFAQTARLSDIPANTSSAPVYTTSDRITRNPALTVSTAGYTVTGYKCAIVAGGTTWGPVAVTGSSLTPAIISQVRATHGPNVIVTIDNIQATNGSTSVTLPAITLKYDQ